MKYLISSLFFVMSLFSYEMSRSKASCEEVQPPRTFNIKYGDHPLQKYELKTPKNANGNTKVVVLIHGGGWVTGFHPNRRVTTFSGLLNWDLETPLLNKGYAVLTMKYRTACYNVQPSQFENKTTFNIDRMVEDVNLVLDNLKQNASRFNINPKHVQLVGESAGAHIALYYGISDKAQKQVKSVVSMYAPTDLDAQDLKDNVYGQPMGYVEPPTFFLKKSANCRSVTYKRVRFWSYLKSFADHNDIKHNEENDFLDTLSTTFAPNIVNNIPMYILHGVNDKLAPVSQADKMYEAMKNKFNTPDCGDYDYSCQLKIDKIENCEHGWTNYTCNRRAIMKSTVTWIEGH